MKWFDFACALGFLGVAGWLFLRNFNKFWGRHNSYIVVNIAAYTYQSDPLVPEWARDMFQAIDELPTLDPATGMES